MGEQVGAGIPYGGVAQLGEHLPCKQGVKGSNPFISTLKAKLSEKSKDICTLKTAHREKKDIKYSNQTNSILP